MIRITDPSQIGPALADLRAMRGLTQGQLAEAAGLWQNRVSSYERGKETPSTVNLLAILRALGHGLSIAPVDDTAAAVDPRWERLIETMATHIRLTAAQAGEAR